MKTSGGVFDVATRVTCYQLVIAANAMGFFVHTAQEHKIGTIPDRTKQLISVAQRLPLPRLAPATTG